MALSIGDTDCTSGLSKRIFDNWSGSPDSGFVSPLSGAAAASVKSLCYAVAKAVVDEIKANARTNPGDASIV